MTKTIPATFLEKLVRWLDPKLERFREKKPEPVVEEPVYTPNTLEDFISVVRRTPASILSKTDKACLASAISFRERRVDSIMLPREKITFVHEHDFMGPLMLDKLYKSGFSHFPVLSTDGRQIVGIIHTEMLNSLEIKKSDRAANFTDKTVYYLRADYTLEQAMSTFLRTNSFFFIVINAAGQVVGLLTYRMLVTHLLGYEPQDDFASDSNLMAVMKRKPKTNDLSS